jgi:hypothetical protein
MIAINWIRKTQKCQNFLLLPLLEEIFRLLDSFGYFYVKHIYKECNSEANSLSKDELLLPVSQWQIYEARD